MKCVKPACQFVVFLACICCSAPSRAESVGVSLMRPDSLAGWDCGQPAPAGWIMKDSCLSGAADATPLLSAWTFGDFSLRLEWSATGTLKILFPDVPTGKGLTLALREADGCGALTDGDHPLTPGKKIAAAAGKKHSAAIERAGSKFSVLVDGQAVCQAELPATRRFGLGLALEGGPASVSNIGLQEPPGQSIFNGKDLKGWWCPGNPEAWAVRDGMITWVKPGGSYIRTEKLYGNFTVSCDYIICKGGNSGVGIRTPRLGWPSADGMEMQIWDVPYKRPFDKHQALAIYGNVPPLTRNDKTGQWNHVVIKADGRMISAWMNGELCQVYNTADHPELRWRNLKGWIGFQDHNGLVQFRNVNVLEAPEGLGLDAWYAPQPTRATACMVDRLMNTQQLAVADGIMSGTAIKKFDVPAKEEQVLAELTGPGAVVRLARTTDEGTLACYFDGETTPRLQWPVRDLKNVVPMFGEDTNPLLTCLTYQKSLKVVLRDIKKATRISEEAKPPKKPKSSKSGKSKLGKKDADKSTKDAAEKTATGAPDKPAKNAPEKALVAKKAEEPKSAEFRLDYVTFPAGVVLESYRDAESGFPRGWLGAMDYRYHQQSGGTMRDYDPLPRYTSGKQTIAPGKTQQLVHVDGAGIVQWLKLETAKLPLDRSDLWLEVTIDGQSKPAVSAPLRFWFPGVAGHGNYHNFTMFDRGGPVLRLAMPFGNGFTASLRNPGSKPVEAVGATISVLPADAANRADILGRMRLHGIYQPAGDTSDELIHIDGAGRWVGLIYQQPEGDKGGSIDSLLVDGKPQAGWQGSSFDSLLGYLNPDARKSLTGRQRGFWWDYLQLTPIDFQHSLVLKATGKKLGERLVLYYAK
jgi:hypothetical protein